ncbi:MAG: class I SAM-dependent methyltransferase [Cytophagales bacterium]|nr:class I SAM-dependent methyltransferase [Cytophagales bacterium]
MLTIAEKQFIQNNLDSDVTKLLLNPPSQFKSNIKFLVEQIRSRQKAKDKLPIWYANPDLIFPPPLSVEQSSSEVMASYKAQLVSGKLLIDLTGGMGVDFLEMSKSFDQAIYVESNGQLCDCMERNASLLDSKVEVINQKAESFLITGDIPVKPVIFIDPDRRSDSRRMVLFSDCSPDVSQLIKTLKYDATHLLIKASPLLDIKAGIKDLEGVREVHVLSVKNECKEVLFLIDFTKETSEPVIKTVNIPSEGREDFNFGYSEEEKAEVAISNPSNFLLIPNASILKAGAFKTIGTRFGVVKIAANTHIYSSDNLIPNFPGRQFMILFERVTPVIIKEYLPQRQVNVITKNYPAKPEEVLKKFKLKEGGELFLIGFRDAQNGARLLLCDRSK